MKCAICAIEIETIQEAMEQGWLPSFYEGEQKMGRFAPLVRIKDNHW
ncbi:MAG TPA: hypothetical protein PK874_06830 [Desulfobacteraceae bacterium]|jgi:hypothetical protein|nr:hypothetical protein [Desulfobacteraceae bacterium]HPQ27034.1 hypothetical protein [Desulfobacteraceae bacterium]